MENLNQSPQQGQEYFFDTTDKKNYLLLNRKQKTNQINVATISVQAKKLAEMLSMPLETINAFVITDSKFYKGYVCLYSTVHHQKALDNAWKLLNIKDILSLPK